LACKENSRQISIPKEVQAYLWRMVDRSDIIGRNELGSYNMTFVLVSLQNLELYFNYLLSIFHEDLEY
jgi:hypothetical protein